METIRHGGWLASKNDELNIANAACVTAEDIQNIPHYWKIHGYDAPTPIFLFIACKEEGVDYFIKATNMPHTKEIFNRKLTPYCLKKQNLSESAQIDKRGYGAILPFLYYGGQVMIQYNIQNNGSFSQIETNIDEQKKQAVEGISDENLSRPSYNDFTAKQQRMRFWMAENIFGSEIIEILKEYKINTLEVFENPSFKNKENLVKDKNEFQHFIEALCIQFEELLHEEKAIIEGIYLERNPETNSITLQKFNKNTLYHNINDKDKTFNDIKIPITTSGLYNLDSSFKLDFMWKLLDNKLVIIAQYTKQDGQKLYYVWKYIGGQAFKSELFELDTEFITDFSAIIGKSKTSLKYCGIIQDINSHPLKADSVEKYANGAYVSINGIRVSQNPITIPLFPKVANTLDHSSQRNFVDIKSQRAAQQGMNLEEFKERSNFKNTSNSPYDNPIVFTLNAFHSFLKKAFDKKINRNEEMLLNVLKSSHQDNLTGLNNAILKGNNLDARLKRIWVEQFPDMQHVTEDSDIKKQILQQSLGTQGGQAVDLFSQDSNGLTLAIQIKSGKKCDVTEIRNFIKTFQDIREKVLENGKRCFGILIHYDGITDKSSSWKELASEPGISVISRDSQIENTYEKFEERIFREVSRLIKYY